MRSVESSEEGTRKTYSRQEEQSTKKYKLIMQYKQRRERAVYYMALAI